MQFNIQPFANIVGDDDDMPFICTPSGVTRLHDNSMIDALDRLRALGSSAGQSAIDQIFSDQSIDPPLAGVFSKKSTY